MKPRHAVGAAVCFIAGVAVLVEATARDSGLPAFAVLPRIIGKLLPLDRYEMERLEAERQREVFETLRGDMSTPYASAYDS